MANEQKTENLVRTLLSQQGYTNDENIIIEQQSSDNRKIDKLLKNASKSGNGKGFPDFIITFKDNPKNLIVIECKASVKHHESKDRKQYKDYAVDGVLLYASYLKDDFNVMSIAISGETEREVKLSHFLWLQGKHTYKNVSDKTILDPKSLFSIIDKQSQPLKEEELIKKAIEYNNDLHNYSIPEIDRCTLISSILVALQDKPFTNSFRSHHQNESDPDYNPNIELIDGLISACKGVLKRNKITDDKSEIILREYEKIKSNHTLRSITVIKNRKQEKNTILRDLIDDVNENIMPYINDNVYDVLGKFYTQFIRYAGSDSKTGLVLTPPHVTDFFCELAEINENDIVFDPCCGTGGFLVSSMKFMLEKSGNNLEKHKAIKSNQLIGIERRADMFSHACSNMMMRGDGKSNIHFGDCFDDNLKESIKAKKPTRVFLNPPYDVGEDGQLEFIENAMDCMDQGGICIAICQMSTVISANKSTIQVRQRLFQKHTLEAVLSMPSDLFYPVGVITCIIILKAHAPHPINKETFFGYFKDDGFLKVKHKGRIDHKNKWKDIKKKWLGAYVNKKGIAGLSVMKKVTPEGEWCAEAHMETDYSKITQNSFEDVVKKYAVFNLMNGRIDG
jgi:type I restriction-modification system DNA methylase subunit